LQNLLSITKTFSHSRSIQFLVCKLGELYFLVIFFSKIFFLQYAEKYGGDTLNRASFDEELNQLDSWLVRANTSIQETRKLTSEEINAAFDEITQITSEVAEMETLFKSLSRRFQVIKQTNK
jgi:hypothetical protein